jgi:hypothetical protein
MGREKPGNEDRSPGGDVQRDEFDELFREMSQELGTDWDLDDTHADDDLDGETDGTGDLPPPIVSIEYALSQIVPELEPDEGEPRPLASMMPGIQTTEQRALSIPTNATLDVQYAVEVATAEGTFVRTEASGALSGARSYKMRILDDFSFGFDAHRNNYEIVLNPNATDVELVDIEGDRDCTLVYEGGQILLDKPAGVRVDVYRVFRTPDGGRGTTKVAGATPENSEQVLLPTDPTKGYDEFSEYMLGIGLADQEKRCYAFSIYAAVKLSRPEPGDEDESEDASAEISLD